MADRPTRSVEEVVQFLAEQIEEICPGCVDLSANEDYSDLNVFRALDVPELASRVVRFFSCENSPSPS